jgi:hypothetical protein
MTNNTKPVTTCFLLYLELKSFIALLKGRFPLLCLKGGLKPVFYEPVTGL